MLTNTAVTIYNRWKNVAQGRYEYHKTVLDAVHWEPRKAVNIAVGGVSVALETDSDKVKVFIPFTVRSTASGSANDTAKTYASPIAFNAALAGAVGGLWTLDEGHGYVFKGNLSSAPTTATEAEIKAIKDATPEAYLITTVDTFDMGSASMRHWEVGGK